MPKEKTIIWRRLDHAGHEYARITTENFQKIIEGAAIFAREKQFCKLDYKIICDEHWETASAEIFGFVGDEKIEVEISVDKTKRWTMNGEGISSVENCTDIDLNFSPLTNTLPIRRLNLAVEEKAKVRAAWLKFPSFALEPLEQIYERTGENSYVYESANGAFRAKIETEEFGLVTRYGHFWEVENFDIVAQNKS